VFATAGFRDCRTSWALDGDVPGLNVDLDCTEASLAIQSCMMSDRWFRMRTALWDFQCLRGVNVPHLDWLNCVVVWRESYQFNVDGRSQEFGGPVGFVRDR